MRNSCAVSHACMHVILGNIMFSRRVLKLNGNSCNYKLKSKMSLIHRKLEIDTWSRRQAYIFPIRRGLKVSLAFVGNTKRYVMRRRLSICRPTPFRRERRKSNEEYVMSFHLGPVIDFPLKSNILPFMVYHCLVERFNSAEDRTSILHKVWFTVASSRRRSYRISLLPRCAI